MSAVAVDVLLGLAVAACWLAALAFLRLRTPLDRLHCAGFVNLAAAPLVAAAVIVQSGGDSRSWKTAALLLLVMLGGAAATHALARAIHLREGERK